MSAWKKLVDESWEFLNKIALQVEQIFSKNDKQFVIKLGQELIISGLTYIHQINPDILRQRDRKAKGRILSAQEHQYKQNQKGIEV